MKKIKREDRERAAKLQSGEDPRKGQRSILNLISHVGLTENEIIQISFKSNKIERRIKKDAAGFADRLMFEYVGDNPERSEYNA